MTEHWRLSWKADPVGARLADGHYSRRKVGAAQFMPPGQTLVLVSHDDLAVWGWHRPHPSSGIQLMSGLSGWTCCLFRNTGPTLSSTLILDAERALASKYQDCGPDGMLTYVWDAKVRSVNPGFCYKLAGWSVHKRRSWDNKKTLLSKPFDLAGVAP